MGVKSLVAGAALFAIKASAQFATYTTNDYSISVNIPADTASSGSGPIFFQIAAPSGTQWVSFGQGNQMSGSNMFVVYSAGDGNVTLSGRAGTGHVMPRHDSSIQLTLLEDSGVNNGALVANVRCDNCNSWNGGSMSFTSTSSNWIAAWKTGSALDTTDTSASISQHDSDVSFRLDLTQGTGGSSSNPFLTTASQPSSAASGSASSSGPQQTASSTGGVSNPIASSNPGSNSASSQQGGGSNISSLKDAHGIIMSLLFIGLFPLVSLTLYLPFQNKVRYIHAPLQILSTILLIVGMALGIVLGQKINQIDGYHMIIGFVVVAMLVLFQPAMGIYQHMHYRKTGGKSAFGAAHRWLGRSLIILGIINGGLGWMIAGETGAYVPYAIVAGIVFLIYVSVLFFSWYRAGKTQDYENEKVPRTGGFEMQQPRSKHSRLSSGPPSPAENAYAEQSRIEGSRQTYTIGRK